MVGINSCSAILCLVSLLWQGTLFSSISFMLSHDEFARDAFLLSLSSATGQVRLTLQIMVIKIILSVLYLCCY